MNASSVPFGSHMSIKTIPFENGRTAGSLAIRLLSSVADLFRKDSWGACGLNNAAWARRIHSSTSSLDVSFGLNWVGCAADTPSVPSGASCTEMVQDHSVPSVETAHRMGHLHHASGQHLFKSQCHTPIVMVDLPRADPTVTGNADLYQVESNENA